MKSDYKNRLPGPKDLRRKKYVTTKIRNQKSEIVNSIDGVISSNELAKQVHPIIKFKGIWHQIIGNPVEPYRLMLSGMPGQGKSTLAIKFAKYLADLKDKDRKILYYAEEEGTDSYTLQLKFKNNNCFHDNIFLSDKLPANLLQFDYVFIDSVNKAKLTPENLIELHKKWPKVSWVYIFQNTKDGKFRGANDYEHDVDVSITLENFFAKTNKSRFGGSGSARSSDQTTAQIYKHSRLTAAQKCLDEQEDRSAIVKGDDGKFWVCEWEHAMQLKGNGFEVLD